mgnify:CR=1 FL=1
MSKVIKLKKKNTRNSKNASMKVRVPGARKSVDCMKYEIANEVNSRSSKKNTSKRNKTTKKSNAK